MSVLFGVPVIRRYDLLEKLLESLRGSEIRPDHVIVVDNGAKYGLDDRPANLSENGTVFRPLRNLGVSGAWNSIVALGKVLEVDRVVISNDDIELHPPTLGRVLAEDADLVRAPGFALFSLRTSVVDRIGWFDENLFPAYFEDNDFARRAKLGGIPIADPQGVPISHVGSASLHCLTQTQQSFFSRRFEALRAYYVSKWGGAPDFETWELPFNGRPPDGWQERPITVGGDQPDEWWLKC